MDLNPSDLSIVQSRTLLNCSSVDEDVELMELSLFSLSHHMGEEYFPLSNGSIFSLSRRTGEKLWCKCRG